MLVALLAASTAGIPRAVAQSTTATLSSVTVEGVAISDFDAELNAYTFGLANRVATATVVATPTISSATVACDLDSDSNATGCQVPLTAGEGTELTLSVTSGTETESYTIVLNRGLTGDFAWKASEDIYGLPAAIAANGSTQRNSRGVWSNGSTLWVANVDRRNKLSAFYAFDLNTKARQSSDNINLWEQVDSLDNVITTEVPFGVAGTADGLVQTADAAPYPRGHMHVRGYRKNSGGEWKPHGALDVFFVATVLSQRGTRGIWNSGQRLYVAHESDPQQIRSYTTNAIGEAREVVGTRISLHEANDDPAGLWSDGATMWVVDTSDRMIYAYDMESGERVTSKEFTSSHLTVKGATISPWGIWSDGATMWVSASDEVIYSFNMPCSTNEPTDGSDTTLSCLRIDDTVLTAEENGSYAKTVRFADERVAVEAVAADSTATVAFLDGDDNLLEDASSIIPGRQIDVDVDETVFKVRVAAQDDTTATYTVTVTRSEPVLTLSMTAAELTEGDDVVLTVTRDGPNEDGIASPGQPAVVFADVPEDAWFHDPVKHLAALGVTTGCSTNPPMYCPQRNVTRAETAAFLSRALGGPPDPSGEVRFPDVGEDAWFYPYVQHIADLGITLGHSDGTYGPNLPVLRSHMALFVFRAFNLAAPPNADSFADVSPEDSAHTAIEALYAANITTGCNAEPLRYCPADTVTRAQMAAFLSRAVTHLASRGDSLDD